MINFFRHIRKKLLGEGSAKKYFFYAVGEIILVVIGILIALQINIWNEHRKQETKTKNYLQALSIEVETNSIIMDNIIERAKKDIQISLKLLTELNTNSVKVDNEYMYHTKLIPIFKRELEHSVLDDILSSGVLDNLPNNKLKRNIFRIKTILENYDENFENAKSNWDDYLLPYLNKHLNVTNLWDSLSVVKMPKLNFKNNLKAFKNNKEFANILASRMRMLANLDGASIRDKKKLKIVKLNIDNYLTND